MTDDINKKISIDLQLNTNAQQQIDNYKAAFDNLRTSINNLRKPLGDLTNNISSLNKTLSDSGEKANRLKSTFSSLIGTFSSWKSLIKDISEGFLSFSNLLSAGLTILTNYGPEILSWINSLINGANAIDKTTIKVNALNQAFQSTDYSNAIAQVDELKAKVDLAKQGFLDKKVVVNQYNEVLGEAMGKVSDLNAVENKLINNSDAYIQMTLNKAAAQIILQDAAKKAAEDALDNAKRQAEIDNTHLASSASNTAQRGQIGVATMLKERKQELAQNKLDQQQYQNEQLKLYEDFQKKNILIAKKYHLKLSSDASSTDKTTNDDLRNGLSEAEKMRTDSLIRQLQATNQFYAAASVSENERFSQEKDRLNNLLKNKQISRKEYNKVIEQLEAEHNANMASIMKKYQDNDQLKTEQAQNELIAFSKTAKDIENRISDVNVVKVNLEKNLQDDISDIAKKAAKQRADFELQTSQKVSDAAFSIITKSIQTQSNAKIRSLENEKNAELSNTSLTAAQKLSIQNKYKKQENAVKLKAFKEEQEASIAQAIINGALAITKAEAQTGVLGTFAIPAIIAQTAIQIATIAAQKPPAMAKGGYFRSDGKGSVLSGYSRTDDTNAYLRSGEAVVVSEAMRDPWARNLVSAINVAYGGRDFSVPNVSRGYAVGGIFTDGGNANRYYNQPMNDSKNLANTIAYQMINNFPPVYVDVKDINNQQNILAQTINRVNL
ncbi:MAG TPA: hypothetical protein VHC47_06600 [Mucilaginibacter sp.]|nr:hypothetical protein [Mucilaginibacter sp.]